MPGPVREIPLLKLNDGSMIPMLGYGTGGAWYKRGEDHLNEQLIHAIMTATQMGYHHLDGAEVYRTEREVGAAIKRAGVDRSKLFVTTKVITNISDIKAAIKESLERLELDYVDLYLIHAPFFAKSDAELQAKWAEMEEVKAAGLAKSIGVSNFLVPHLEAILKTAKVVPAINQIEFHPYLQHPPLLHFHRAHGIATAAYGPLTATTKAKGGPVDGVLSSLAQKYGVSENEICLRWCIDQDIVTLTTSSKKERCLSYLKCLDFQLTRTEIDEVSRVGEQKHVRAFWKDKFNVEDRS